MPIYEYECASCGKPFEELVGISAPNPDCPHCQGKQVRKKVSASAFVLKGGGWYKDHYGLKPSSGDSSGSSSPSSSSSTAAPAAAPAAAAPSAPSGGGSTGGGGSTPAAA